MYSNYSLILNWFKKRIRKTLVEFLYHCCVGYFICCLDKAPHKSDLKEGLSCPLLLEYVQSIVAGRGQPQECEAVGHIVCIVGSSKRWRWELI